MFKLRFPTADLARWAERYDYQSDNVAFERDIAPRARRRGYLTRDEFIELCLWKTPRTQALVKLNASDVVEAVTRAALESRQENVKIGVLRALHGVSWPTASVVLHFCDKQPYPILDFRALWSLGYRKPPFYTLDFWLAYTAVTRELATTSGLSMRLVDRALWQYSNERQRA